MYAATRTRKTPSKGGGSRRLVVVCSRRHSVPRGQLLQEKRVESNRVQQDIDMPRTVAASLGGHWALFGSRFQYCQTIEVYKSL